MAAQRRDAGSGAEWCAAGRLAAGTAEADGLPIRIGGPSDLRSGCIAGTDSRVSLTSAACGANERAIAHTALRRPPAPDAGEKIDDGPASGRRNCAIESGRPALLRRGNRRIGKKIIGHSARRIPAIRRVLLGGKRGLRTEKRLHGFAVMLALFHEPASEHGGGGLLLPLIEQSGNLLSKISGVRKTCEFKALQAVTGSREQEIPRRLGSVTGQGNLPVGTTVRYHNSNIKYKYFSVWRCGKRSGAVEIASGSARGRSGSFAEGRGV